MDAANGRDERPVVTEWAPKSMSRETTFERDLHPRHDRETLTRILLEYCQRLSGDLVRARYLGKTIGIKLRYADFHTLTRDITSRRRQPMWQRSAARRARASNVPRSIAACACSGYELPRSWAHEAIRTQWTLFDDHACPEACLL